MLTLIFYIFSVLLVTSAFAVVFARNPVHSVLSLIFAFFNAAGLMVILGAEFLAMTLIIVYVGAVAVLFLFVVMMLNINPAEQKNILSFQYLKESWYGSSRFILYLVVFSTIFVSLSCIPFAADYVKRIGSVHDWATFKQILMASPWIIFGPNTHILVSLFIASVSFGLARPLTEFFTGKTFTEVLTGFVESLGSIFLLAGTIIGFFVLMGVHWVSSPFSEETAVGPMPPIDLKTNTHALAQSLYTDYILAFQGVGLILLVAMIGAIALTLRHRHDVRRQNISDQVRRDPKKTMELRDVPLRKGVE